MPGWLLQSSWCVCGRRGWTTVWAVWQRPLHRLFKSWSSHSYLPTETSQLYFRQFYFASLLKDETSIWNISLVSKVLFELSLDGGGVLCALFLNGDIIVWTIFTCGALFELLLSGLWCIMSLIWNIFLNCCVLNKVNLWLVCDVLK